MLIIILYKDGYYKTNLNVIEHLVLIDSKKGKGRKKDLFYKTKK